MDIVLVAVDGDVDPGTEYLITPDEPVPIGRSAKGVTLLDPLVSIQHAVVSFDLARGYVIQDLDSATGTWVDEECIKGASRPIGVGTMLRFGDTTFEVARANRLPWWTRPVGGAAMALVLIAVLLYLIPFAGAGPTDLRVEDRLNVSGRDYETLQPDHGFLRDRGISMRELSLKRITDHDSDGIDELWLAVEGGRELLITFNEGARDTSEWVVLGEFPSECTSQESGAGVVGFPFLQCEGTTWMMYDDGRYHMQDHEGPVVYYLPKEGSGGIFDFFGREDPEEEPRKKKRRGRKAKEAPKPRPKNLENVALPGAPVAEVSSAGLKAARFSIKNTENLASFLTDRNILGPVHYIICENAFPGLRAQVLTTSEGVRDMGLGCLQDLRLEGLVEGDPVAVALSAPGHRALIDDVVTFYAGNPDGLWLKAEDREIRDALEQSPGWLQGGTVLVAVTQSTGMPSFDPIPGANEQIKQKAHPLMNLDQRVAASAVASTATPTKEGLSRIETSGCADLIVDVNRFENHGWRTLLPGTFATVWDQGCGRERRRLMKLDYAIVGTGVRDARVGDLEVRAAIETRTDGRGTEVKRLRVTYRSVVAPGSVPTTPARSTFEAP